MLREMNEAAITKEEICRRMKRKQKMVASNTSLENRQTLSWVTFSFQSTLQILMYAHNIILYYKIWKKHNEIQLTKNKMDLNNRKMTNHPPCPVGEKIRYHSVWL